MNARATLAIALQQLNDYNVFFFRSLNMGKYLHINKWKEVTITEEITLKVLNMTESRYTHIPVGHDDNWNQ